MFEVGGTYANRVGTYTVLEVNDPKMKVRYTDGSEASLRMNIQGRIWENILAERIAAAAKSRKKGSKQKANASHFIKVLSISEESDLSIPGLRQRVAAVVLDKKIAPGDRFIYYAVEPRLFFAVATVTSKPKKGKAKDYMFGGNPKAKIHIYPIDVDAHIKTLNAAIGVDTMELESIPGHAALLIEPDTLHPINEDDFELLAELIMEVDADLEEETTTTEESEVEDDGVYEIDA